MSDKEKKSETKQEPEITYLEDMLARFDPGLPLLSAKEENIHPEFDDVFTIQCRECVDAPVLVCFCNSRDSAAIQCAKCGKAIMFLAVASRVERMAAKQVTVDFFTLLNKIRKELNDR